MKCFTCVCVTVCACRQIAGNGQRMITEFLRGVSECMSDRMHDLLSRMLQPDHYNRPTAVECLQFLGACLSSDRTTPVYTYMYMVCALTYTLNMLSALSSCL